MSNRRNGNIITPANSISSIPKELANHYAFRGYNCGCCGKLVGNLAVVSIFVSDTVSSWNSYDRAKYKCEVNEACNFLLNNGGRKAGLRIKEQIFNEARLPYLEKRSSYKQNIIDVLSQMGFDSFMSYRESIFQTYPNIDTVAVFFVFNKDNRSFALSVKGHKTMQSTRRSDSSVGEYSVIYAQAHGKIAYTISYPDATIQIAKQYAPQSIMLCSYNLPNIDELSQVLIGWKTDIDFRTLSFYNKISNAVIHNV